MVKKWYFAISQSSIDRSGHDWRGLIRVAVFSLIRNTNLVPHLIYDGEKDGFIDEMIDMGVKVIFHRVSFYNKLAEREFREPGYLSIASGAFLRVEIPKIEQDEKYVLYTDCDVMFLGAPELDSLKPTIFAAAPQFDKTNYRDDMNSGVMLLDVVRMRDELDDFTDYIVSNLTDKAPGFDQYYLRSFFYNRWEELPLTLNWKPYWGKEREARIVHWHGPKPRAIRDYLAETQTSRNDSLKFFFDTDRDSYKYYYGKWLEFSQALRPTVFGHVDLITKTHVLGWALNESNLDDVLTLWPEVNGIKLSPVLCNGKRSDLQKQFASNVGTFAVEIPSGLSDQSENKLSFFDGTGKPVFLSHKGKRASSITIVASE